MDFLYVSSDSFGRVRVNQVDYCNETITVDITDCSTCMSGTLCIDINEHGRPAFMMVNWTDVVDMVSDYQASCWGCDDLLEFDF